MNIHRRPDLLSVAIVYIAAALFGCAAPLLPTPNPPALPRTATPTFLPITAFPSETQTAQPIRRMTVTFASPSETPRPHAFDDVDSLSILSTLFPNLKFTHDGDAFMVEGDPKWQMWVNSRAEGVFTDRGGDELAVIVANEQPEQQGVPSPASTPWGSFLAVLGRNGDLDVIHRTFPFPVSISPFAFDAKIDRVIDYDHDDQDDLLITTSATRSGVTTKAAFLFQWSEQSFSQIWSGSIGEDNTAALNQPQYYSSSSLVQFSDIDAAGVDTIIVDTTRIDYMLGAQGLPDLEREIVRRVERRVYTWTGGGYSLDPSRATPFAPIATPPP